MSSRELEHGLANVIGAVALGVSDRLASDSDSAALVTLLERGGLTIEWLRQIVGISHSATVRLVDRLTAEGLVERRPGPDRRSVSIRLSVHGQAAAARLRAQRDAQLMELIDALDAEEGKALRAIAEKLAAQLVTGRWEARLVCRLCDHGACTAAGGCPVDHAASLAGE
jgi:DNA-binding MarR family transcriptional regulator